MALLPLVILLSACAAAPAAPPPRAPAGQAQAPVVLAPVVVSPYSDGELAAQFEQGRAALLADRPREAADIFERLVRLAPDGEVAPPSLFNAGVAREALGDREAAAARYRDLLARFPEHAASRGGLFRLMRVAAHLERWQELVDVAGRLLARGDLTVLEAIEARGSSALGLVEQDRVDDAAREVAVARDLVEQHRLGEAGKPPIELAPVSFALGEVRRRRSEVITFDVGRDSAIAGPSNVGRDSAFAGPSTPPPASFADALEQRCQGLLDAQSAYTEAMRSLDAHWSAMAGFRIGQLYQQLHRDVMRAPPPPNADTLKKKQLFEGAMRLRYRVLLEKGHKMLAGTVRLGERTGESSAWVLRARDAQREIELALADERAALAKLPFTEAELQAALDALKGPANAGSRPTLKGPANAGSRPTSTPIPAKHP